MNNVFKMTKEGLLKLNNYYNGEKFNQIIIIPTNDIHDSGFNCMKYILLDKLKIVGVVDSDSDVIHINGICGLGKEPNYKSRIVKAHDLRIDCLPVSKCLRLFSDDYMDLPCFFGSDFIPEFIDYKVSDDNGTMD